MSTVDTGTTPLLSDIHRNYLLGHAISLEIIARTEIFSAGEQVIFPWRDGNLVTPQSRLWPEPEDGLPEGAPKYLWPANSRPQLWAIRPMEDLAPDAPVIVAEGTKQSLAVASNAPAEYAVYGMPGCDIGQVARLQQAGLNRFAGRRVVIMLDADAADNLNVYEGGEKLAELLDLEGAAEIAFTRLPAQGTDGIDDFLASVPEERRDEMLAKLIARAQPKPADRKPARDMRKIPDPGPDTGGLPLLVVNEDRLQVIRTAVGHMQQRWAGVQLFSYGGAMTRLRGTRTEPLDRDSFANWLAETVSMYKRREATQTTLVSYEASWPDATTMGALLARGDEFPELTRVSQTPFARADGSICAKNGYDADTGTMLITGNSGMDRLDIPDEPSQDQAAAAASFLLDTWLGPQGDKRGMPWRDEASRAGTLALLLTPFIRGLVPLVPLAVISGLQPGVGKNLLADCISLVVTGANVMPLPWMEDDDEENAKKIHSAFREGHTMMCFDEAHVIGGSSLTRAITATTYSDRILGVSKMASYPNNVTWIALGNQVSVLADMARRAYWIELYPDGPDPENRPEETFAHPDPRGWTLENRPELVTKVLILIRAWFAARQPAYPRGSLMGSFEKWDKVMSGILGYAGVSGFLDNLTERRAERDTTGGFWTGHLAWLWERFGSQGFTSLDVKNKAMASSGTWEAPPHLEDTTSLSFARDLGLAYAKVQDRWFGEYRITRRDGVTHRKVARWYVEFRGDGGSGGIGGTSPGSDSSSDQSESPDGGIGGIGGSTTQVQVAPETALQRVGVEGVEGVSPLSQYAPAHAHARTRAHTRGSGDPRISPHSLPGLAVRADIETDDAKRLFLIPRGTPLEEGGFIRLTGILGPNGEPLIEDINSFCEMLGMADRIDGHNFMGFDGLALAWHHGMDWNRLAPKIRDTELIARQVNPPRSRETGGKSNDRYGLDAVAAEMGLPGKTDDLKRLKALHGGYGLIPPDDPEYRSYLEGDLRATALVSDRLMPYYDSDSYLRREHLLAQLAGQMSLNGFRVDTGLLAQRKAEVDQAKADAAQALHDGWGLPLSREVMKGRGKGKHAETEVFKSPLATDEGKAWLERQFGQFGVTDPPRTPKSRDLATGADELRPIMNDPSCSGSLRDMLGLMEVVTKARTVYQTATECLAPDGRVHPRVSMRQASGRWSVTDPGLTVFGKRGGKHVERDIFIPDEGHVLLSADLSQVDMRAIAGHCQDPAYMAMFGFGDDGKPLDPHMMIAEQLGITREVAKTVGHGWNYGRGAAAMIKAGMDPEKVWGFVNGMEARFSSLIGWRAQIQQMGEAGHILDNGFGRRMRCEPSRAYTVAPALMGQGGARDIMCECLLRLPRELWPFLRVMVHDEIVLSVPCWAAEEIGHILREAMTWIWRDVPILCDLSKPGLRWGDISDKLTMIRSVMMTGLLQPGYRYTAWQYAQVRGMRNRDPAFLIYLGKRAATLARQHCVPEWPKVLEDGFWVYVWPEDIWTAAWPETDPRSPPEGMFWEAHLRLGLPGLKGLIPQYEVTVYNHNPFRQVRYFPDFAIPGQRGGFVVEIDGFKTHSTREDQVDDNQRQRNLHRSGWHVERYTGKEVSRDAEWCVRDAARLAGQWRRRMPDSS